MILVSNAIVKPNPNPLILSKKIFCMHTTNKYKKNQLNSAIGVYLETYTSVSNAIIISAAH